MQSDPVGLEGGENSFVYVGDNPLVRVDKDGKFVVALPWIEPVVAAATRWVLKKAAQAIPAVIALALSGDENQDDKNRGRIQIQNNTDLKAGITVSWASPYPPSKADGLMALKMLETELSKVNKKMYKRLKQCRAFEKAATKIKQDKVLIMRLCLV